LKRLEIQTINECNRAISTVLEVLPYSSLREFKMPINAIGPDEVLYIMKIISENKKLAFLDLSFET
jgi:hypothetical protein